MNTHIQARRPRNSLAYTQDPSVSRLAVVALVVATMIAVALIVFGSQGPRGTDQYNYYSDSITLLEDREALTTLHFPARLIREGNDPTPNYFTHHGPVLALAAWVGQWTGVYPAWMAINIVSHLLVALVILVCCRRFIGGTLAYFIAAFYLLSPIALWQSMNVLQEQFFAALTALVVLGYIYREKPEAHLALLLGLFVGVLSHPFYVVLLAAYLVYCLLCCVMARSLTQAVAGVAFTLLVAAIGAWLKFKSNAWFPTTFQPNLEAIITSALPNTNSNMHWHYSLEQVPVTLELLIAKLKVAARLHFIDVKSAPFFIFTNLAILAWFGLFLIQGKRYWKILLGLGLPLGVYASMLVLQQNQVRYQQMVAPVTFIVLALALYQLPRLLRHPALLTLALVPLVAVGTYLARYSHNETLKETNKILATEKMFTSVIPDTARVVALDVIPHSPMAYSLQPRQVMSVRTDMLAVADINKAVALFNPTYLISSIDSVGVVDTNLWQRMHNLDTAYFGAVEVYNKK